jgi:hypothetical protein
VFGAALTGGVGEIRDSSIKVWRQRLPLAFCGAGLIYSLALLAALAVSVWIFGGVLHDVLAHEEIALIDAPIVSYISIHRLPWLTGAWRASHILAARRFSRRLSFVGSLCLRLRTGSWRPLVPLASAAVGAVALDTVLKFAIARPRPATEWMVAKAVGSRLISLVDYRELRFVGSARETGKGRSFCKNLKSGSYLRPTKPRRRLVGSHRGSIDLAKPDLMVSWTDVSQKRDRRFLLTALFFAGCLMLVGLGL